MEETYWKQFMVTGRIEDYLHFKGVSDIEDKAKNKEERMNQRDTDRRYSDRDILK